MWMNVLHTQMSVDKASVETLLVATCAVAMMDFNLTIMANVKVAFLLWMLDNLLWHWKYYLVCTSVCRFLSAVCNFQQVKQCVLCVCVCVCVCARA